VFITTDRQAQAGDAGNVRMEMKLE
jgi:hypothetical protein